MERLKENQCWVVTAKFFFSDYQHTKKSFISAAFMVWIFQNDIYDICQCTDPGKTITRKSDLWETGTENAEKEKIISN